MLLKGLDNKNLHLGIDTYKVNRPYFARTLLITEGDNAGKFIGKADERLKVSKLEIRDKDTNQLLIFVERELAEQTALEEVEKYSEEWFTKEFPILLKNHFVDYAGNKIFDVLMQHINFDWMQKVSTIDENVETAWNMKEETDDSSEGLKLLLDVLSDRLSDKIFVRSILTVNPELITDYEAILTGCIRASHKKAWRLSCRRYIEQNKPDIKDKVEKLDSYWVGKIVGEAIRKYAEEDLDAAVARHIAEYTTLEMETVVTDLLAEKLSEQKELVLGKMSTLFT